MSGMNSPPMTGISPPACLKAYGGASQLQLNASAMPLQLPEEHAIRHGAVEFIDGLIA